MSNPYASDFFSDDHRPRVEHLEILGLIGKGGMASVYKAKDPRTGRIVALKVLHPDLCLSKNYVKRFLREADNLIALDHPNIVKGYEVGHTDISAYIVMEFVEGKNLHALVNDSGPLKVPEVVAIAGQVARALSHAHEHGKVHRDIKPSNLILTPDGTVKVTDLGLIRGETDPILTGASVVLGSPYYISPEQASGCEDIDIRSDIYSLGATLVHLLTGRAPFEGEDTSLILTKQITDDIEIPWDRIPSAGSRFRYVLSKMISKRRQMRYQTPAELLADLEELDDFALVETLEAKSCPSRDKPPVDMQELFSPPEWKTSRPEIHTVLSDAQINTLSRDKAIFRRYDPGCVLFYEGSCGRDFFILLSGTCEVLRSGKRLALLEKPGSCFGEIAALLGIRRTATIRTIQPSECLKIPPDYLQEFLIHHPRVQFRLLEIALKRLSDLDEEHARTEERIARANLELLRLLRSVQGLSAMEIIDRLHGIREILGPADVLKP